MVRVPISGRLRAAENLELGRAVEASEPPGRTLAVFRFLADRRIGAGDETAGRADLARVCDARIGGDKAVSLACCSKDARNGRRQTNEATVDKALLNGDDEVVSVSGDDSKVASGDASLFMVLSVEQNRKAGEVVGCEEQFNVMRRVGKSATKCPFSSHNQRTQSRGFYSASRWRRWAPKSKEIGRSRNDDISALRLLSRFLYIRHTSNKTHSGTLDLN